MPKNKRNFRISASLDGFTDNSKVIIANAITGKVLDSAVLINNQFISEGVIEEPPISVGIVIKTNDNEAVNTFLFIGNEDVRISGNKTDFPDALTISGSKYQVYKTDLDSQIGPLNKERNEKLQKMFSLRQEGKWNDSLQYAYWSKEDGIINQIDQQTNKITKEFIEKNINSDYALSQLITYKTEFSKDFIEKQIEDLNSEYKNSVYANVLKTYLGSESLEKGDRFFDFTAENQNGERVTFSNFFKNKYVLLEFYSPYCSWCVKALPAIKNLAEEKSADLEIITVNVDKNKEDWIEKYKSNHLTWTSVFDEKGRHSDMFTKYRVFGTPTYYLFDQNGTVVEKWTGYNDNLIEQIELKIESGG